MLFMYLYQHCSSTRPFVFVEADSTSNAINLRTPTIRSRHEVALKSASSLLLGRNDISTFKEPMIELQSYNDLQTGTGPR